MVLIALLYYQNEKRLYFDLTKTKMQNVVSNISSQIIVSHMNGKDLELKQFLKPNIYQISFYNKNKVKVLGNIDEQIDFSKNIIEKEKYFILVDKSTYGHLGIHYIAIKENLFFKTINKLKTQIIFVFLLIYTILSILGFYLAKLFLKPIKDEREKLNNFIKDTTHELNTPISAILMSSESEELTNKQIQRVKLAAQKVSEIYKDLTYVFLEDKNDLSHIKEHNLKELIEKQLAYFEALALRKKITIKASLDDTFFNIDQNDFTRLFNNIISNAIKYNRQKGSIFIELNNNSLKIKDSGVGINQEDLKDIFNRYYRATKEQGGFGIGLNIVKNICEKYDIKIDVNSQEKEGTTFTLHF